MKGSKGLQIRAHAAPWRRGMELVALCGEYVGKHVVMEEQDPAIAVEPTVEIEMDAAQTLMDDLWAAGLRPTEGTPSTTRWL